MIIKLLILINLIISSTYSACLNKKNHCANPEAIGFYNFEGSSSWFMSKAVNVSWLEAKSLCESYGSVLPSIHNNVENSIIELLIENPLYNDYYDGYYVDIDYKHINFIAYWLGGFKNENGDWEWLDNTPFDFENWSWGEPNNVNGKENAVGMWNNAARHSYWVRETGKWNDADPTIKTLGVICRLKCSTCDNPKKYGFIQVEGSDYWYATNSKGAKFNDAKSYCENYGATLPSIHSQIENNIIENLTNSQNTNMIGYWLGGYKNNNGNWAWLDNTPFDFENWSLNEPNNVDGTENALEMWNYLALNSQWIREAGKWNDDTSSRNYGIICQLKC